jgi:hypothetical protein
MLKNRNSRGPSGKREMAELTRPGKYGERWTREELILAFGLYCRIPLKTKAIQFLVFPLLANCNEPQATLTIYWQNTRTRRSIGISLISLRQIPFFTCSQYGNFV